MISLPFLPFSACTVAIHALLLRASAADTCRALTVFFCLPDVYTALRSLDAWVPAFYTHAFFDSASRA